MSEGPRVRLDKWLWAARFYRSRARARQAIEGGKVKVDGEPAKVSRRVQAGMRLSVRRGPEPEIIEVLGVSEQRGPAPQARALYRETDDSLAHREAARLQRKAAGPVTPCARPDKRSRRLIHRFKRELARD